ncbi:MAG TPA: M20/M25/M40 family metallo-hydrolase [Terriglobales bacterium]|nr:M20/M25/M40 family metallo-hydrolase [Terriglobales bacterium]
MRTFVCLLGLLAFALPVTPQNRPTKSSYDEEKAPPSPPPLSPQLVRNLSNLRDAALGDDYALRQVAYLCDNIGPRPTGSPQAQAAVEYVASELKKLGLDVHLEETKVPHWQRGVETAELTEYPGQPRGTTQKIVLTALGGNTPTPDAGISAEVVVVSNLEQLAALGRDRVAGKIVLFNEPYDKQKAAAGFWGEAYGEAVAYRGRGPKAAAELGAVAALVRSVGGADFRIPHTGYSQPAGIPAGAVTSEDADLISHLAAQGKLTMHMVLTSQNGPDVMSYNVIGDLKGSEHPEQVVIVSGHLDSWDLGTGAIDDAAGVAVAMETAKLVQQLKLHPRRTIRVIAWMDEENGGRGHDAYAALHASDMANHIAAIESDLGSDHPFGFAAKVNDRAIAALEPVKEILRPMGANLIHQTEYSPGSDIAPLGKAGVPTLGILQDGRTYFNYHHTPADTLDKVVPEYLRENAAAMAVMGYVLADMPDPLPR